MNLACNRYRLSITAKFVIDNNKVLACHLASLGLSQSKLHIALAIKG